MLLWNLSNSTKYSAGVSLAADRDGRDIWLTVVKATFDVALDGTTELAAEQFPVMYVPVFRSDPMRSSLLVESDVDYAKPGVDVLMQGTAQAPEAKAVRELIVGLEVDGHRKLLRVYGERVWSRDGLTVVPSQAEPFTRMPIVYERAYGGFDPLENGAYDARNPAGCGYGRERGYLVGRPAPQIEEYSTAGGGVQSRPAGFGPIARHWLPRRSLAGSYDERWQENRMPLLPLDFDERFFFAAPEDQQFPQLRHRALIRVAGMSAHGMLNFKLPRVVLGLHVQLGPQEVYRRPRLRTVLILPDPRQVVMTYVDAMECTGTKYTITDTEVVEKQLLN